MTDLVVRREGRAGCLTLNRPQALNALTWDMVRGIDAALRDWADDPDVALVLIDGAGDKAFCAGGDIAEMYASGNRGDVAYGRRFWQDEYRMNARLARYPKPVVTFLNGFTMGGGVGVGCHAAHRIVGDGSKIAMPECSIGLVPDVGGSLLLARAPGRLGEYLGTTGDRMAAGDAIHAGFADHYLPEAEWTALKAALCRSGDVGEVMLAAAEPAPSRLAAGQRAIDAHWSGDSLADLYRGLTSPPTGIVGDGFALMEKNSPLSMAVTIELVHRVRRQDSIEAALDAEYRVTSRAMGQGDFLEGIRAAIIDRDRSPVWRHASWRDVTEAEVAAMLRPLGAAALRLEETT